MDINAIIYMNQTKYSHSMRWFALQAYRIQYCERVYIKGQDFWLPTGVKLRADLQVPCTRAIGLLKGLNYSFSIYRKSKVTHLTNPYSILCLIQADRCQQTTSMIRNKSSTLGQTQPVSFPDVLTAVTKLLLFQTHGVLQVQQVPLCHSSTSAFPPASIKVLFILISNIMLNECGTKQVHLVSLCQTCCSLTSSTLSQRYSVSDARFGDLVVNSGTTSGLSQFKDDQVLKEQTWG